MVELARVPLAALDTLWVQLTGTLCNLKCKHCFISCSPTNDRLGMMSRAQVSEHLADARRMGAGEFYVTGGEPFLHDDALSILDELLAAGPVTVLTNGVLIDEHMASALKASVDARGQTLEFRVSLDGPDAPSNDAIRGNAVFVRALEGVRQLVSAGFRPIMTMMRSWPKEEDEAVLGRFRSELAQVGYDDARIKLLPILHMGAEEDRSRAYLDQERVSAGCIQNYDLNNLLCHRTRVVSAEGVHVCPILVGEDEGRMGDRLDEATGPYTLGHQACFTCVVNGAICSNDTSA